MLGILFVIGSAIGAWHTFNALRPIKKRGRRGLGPLWVFALVTGELVWFHLTWQAALIALFWWGGALDTTLGQIGLALTGASWAGMVVLQWRTYRARPVLDRALRDGLGPDYLDRLDPAMPQAPDLRVRQWPPSLLSRRPDGVERVAGIRYGPHRRQVLDILRPADLHGPAPVLLEVHGGSWVRGRHDRQAQPLQHHLAARGWICLSASYRVSPEATYPDHLVDVKRVVAWIRSEGIAHGCDPEFVAVTGGSAGGHLAAMLALTPNDPTLQPGFADADTSVAACVPFYGIFDLLRRDGRTPLWPFLRHVMKSTPAEDPAAWRAAAPIHRVGPDAPPFLLLHGGADSLVRPSGSERFAAALRETSREVVVHAELPGATHGFDYFRSRRSSAAAHAVGRFLSWVYAAHTAADRRLPPGG